MGFRLVCAKRFDPIFLCDLVFSRELCTYKSIVSKQIYLAVLKDNLWKQTDQRRQNIPWKKNVKNNYTFSILAMLLMTNVKNFLFRNNLFPVGPKRVSFQGNFVNFFISKHPEIYWSLLENMVKMCKNKKNVNP